MLVIHLYGRPHSLTMTNGRIWNCQGLTFFSLSCYECMTAPSGPVHGIITKTKIGKAIYRQGYVFMLLPYFYNMGSSACFLGKVIM